MEITEHIKCRHLVKASLLPFPLALEVVHLGQDPTVFDLTVQRSYQ